MRRQGLRPIAVALSLAVLTAGPAKASPIHFADVVAQAVATGVGGRQTYDLRLRAVPQSGRTTAAGTQTPPPSGGSGQGQAPADTSGNPSVTNTEVQTPGQGGNVEVVQLGDVTGTVCDCGEILLPEAAGGFPKLPFLALGAIPFFFLNRGKDIETPTSTPTPTVTPSEVPEPATLLLLGSGLAALGARARRRRTADVRRQVAPPVAGEV
jgi:PEP-CTERM motif